MRVASKIGGSGIKLLYAYIIIYYLIPFLGDIYFTGEYTDKYQNADHFWPLIFLIVTLLFIHIIDISKISIKTFRFKRNFITRVIDNNNFNIFLCFVFLALSISFWVKFNIKFRHKNTLVNGGLPVMALFAIRIYFKAILLLYIFKFFSGYKLNKKDRFITFLIGLSLILSLNSSFDVLFVFTAIMFFLNKQNLLFVISKNKIKNSFVRGKIKYIVIIIVFIIIIYFGYSNKFGSERAIRMMMSFKPIILKVCLRLSVWYSSLKSSAVYYFTQDHSYIWDALSGTLETNAVNFKKLLGISSEKPNVWSIKRSNFLHLVKDTNNPKTGTSEGIFATMFYIPFFPLGLFLVSFYITYILRQFGYFFNKKTTKISLSGLFILIFFLNPFFESPLDMLNIFNTGIIYFATFYFGIKNIKHKTIYNDLES